MSPRQRVVVVARDVGRRAVLMRPGVEAKDPDGLPRPSPRALDLLRRRRDAEAERAREARPAHARASPARRVAGYRWQRTRRPSCCAADRSSGRVRARPRSGRRTGGRRGGAVDALAARDFARRAGSAPPSAIEASSARVRMRRRPRTTVTLGPSSTTRAAVAIPRCARRGTAPTRGSCVMSRMLEPAVALLSCARAG